MLDRRLGGCFSEWTGLVVLTCFCLPARFPHQKQALTEQLKCTRDEEETSYLNSKMQAVIARLYCMTGQSKVQGAFTTRHCTAPQDRSVGRIDVLKPHLLHPPQASSITSASTSSPPGPPPSPHKTLPPPPQRPRLSRTAVVGRGRRSSSSSRRRRRRRRTARRTSR